MNDFISSRSILAMATALLGWLLHSGCDRMIGGRVEVTIENRQSRTIEDVQLRFSGNGVKVGSIGAGERRLQIISPDGGETGLSFWYTDATGRQHEKDVGVYWEGRHRGRLEIVVEPSGELTCIEDGRRLGKPGKPRESALTLETVPVPAMISSSLEEQSP